MGLRFNFEDINVMIDDAFNKTALSSTEKDEIVMCCGSVEVRYSKLEKQPNGKFKRRLIYRRDKSQY